MKRPRNAELGSSSFPTKKSKGTPGIKKKYKKKSKPFQKGPLIRLIKSVITNSAEKKEFINYGANQGLLTASGTTPAYINLIPAIAQGTGASQRVGNEINVTNGWIRIAVNLLPYNVSTNPNPAPLWVKMWILYPKQQQGTTLSSLTPAIASTMFKLNNANTGPQGNTLDMVLPINDNLWGVLQDQTKRLGVTGVNATGPASTTSWMDNSQMSAIFDFDITKHLGKLQYNDTTSNDPTNKSLFLVMQAVNADGTSGSLYTMCEYHFSFCMQYTDM